MTDRIIIECQQKGCADVCQCSISLIGEREEFSDQPEFICPWDGKKAIGKITFVRSREPVRK